MPITLFDNDIPPYPNGRSPEPDELDEFGFLTRKELLHSLRQTGLIKADFTNGAWVVRMDDDGTYSGEVHEWHHSTAPECWSFSDADEHEALDIAVVWADLSAG